MHWEAWREAKKAGIKPFTNPYQERLIGLCFGGAVPNASKLVDLPKTEDMNIEGLQSMTRMTLIEFLESIQKERWKQDLLEKSEPKPFDIFVMKASGSPHREYLAVALPMQKGQGTMWYDGGRSFRRLRELAYKGKIGNLVGSARVLEALAAAESGKGNGGILSLTLLATERSFLVERPPDWKAVLAPHKALIAHLNDSQKSAVATVTSPHHFKEGFFVVQGPPGCGKTTTMVAMIRAMKSGVLVVAPSNAAVANIAIKLHATNQYNLNELVVFGRKSDPSVHFLNPLNRGEKFQEMNKRYESKKGNPIAQENILKECKDWLRVSTNSTASKTMSDLSSYCPFIDLDNKSGRNKLTRLLKGGKVVLSTLNSSGSNMLKNSAKVHTALFDEAGQASEADFYVLTNFPGIKRIALVGDPMQLPATVLHQKCQQAGYGESWMKRVYQKHPDKVHLLDTQYRMDPKILDFPNNSFYNNRILSGLNVSQRSTTKGAPKIHHPFQCVDTCGRGIEQKRDMSWKNDFEVETIRDLLQRDGDIQRLLDVQPDARIIIIAPYRAQVRLLQERVKAPRKTARLDIATVDSFQGQEGDVVIFSTVRTKRLGFVDDGNRLNVAITRAKRILRIVGDAKFFLSKPQSCLARLFRHAQATEAMCIGKVLAVTLDPKPNPTQTKATKKKKKKKKKNEASAPVDNAKKDATTLPVQPSKRKRRRRRKKKPGNP
jgi:hypothetical protein